MVGCTSLRFISTPSSTIVLGVTRNRESRVAFLSSSRSLSLSLQHCQHASVPPSTIHSKWLTALLASSPEDDDDGVDGTVAYHPNRTESSRQVKRFRDLCALSWSWSAGVCIKRIEFFRHRFCRAAGPDHSHE